MQLQPLPNLKIRLLIASCKCFALSALGLCFASGGGAEVRTEAAADLEVAPVAETAPMSDTELQGRLSLEQLLQPCWVLQITWLQFLDSGPGFAG